MNDTAAKSNYKSSWTGIRWVHKSWTTGATALLDKGGSSALIPEHVLGGGQSVGCALWKLSSGSITGLWFSKDAILPGGRQDTGHCSVTECKAVYGPAAKQTWAESDTSGWDGGVTAN